MSLWCHLHPRAASQHLIEERWLDVQFSTAANFLAGARLFFLFSVFFSLLESVPFFYLCVVYERNDKKQTGHLATVCLCTTIVALPLGCSCSFQICRALVLNFFTLSLKCNSSTNIYDYYYYYYLKKDEFYNSLQNKFQGSRWLHWMCLWRLPVFTI